MSCCAGWCADSKVVDSGGRVSVPMVPEVPKYEGVRGGMQGWQRSIKRRQDEDEAVVLCFVLCALCVFVML